MRTFVSAVAVIAFSSAFAAVGLAAPVGAPPAGMAANPSIVQVQGWWERDHLDQRARDGYWRLPPPMLHRYNDLQRQINQLTQQREDIDNRINRAEREQREMLGIR
jgi:hypothetical protein